MRCSRGLLRVVLSEWWGSCADAGAAYYRSTAEGCLFQALSPLAARDATQGPLLQRLLEPCALPAPGVPQGSRDIPAPSTHAPPVGQPVEKDRVHLQVRPASVSVHGGRRGLPGDGTR